MNNNKKTIKINLKSGLIISMFLIMIVLLGVYLGAKFGFETLKENLLLLDNVSKKYYKEKEYYIIEDDYSGEYDIQYISLSEYFNTDIERENTFEKSSVMNYEEYNNYCSEWNLKKAYNDKNQNYIVFSYMAYGMPNIEARLANIEYKENMVKLYIWDRASGITADISAYVLVIPTSELINTVEYQALYTNKEFENLKKYGSLIEPAEASLDKPIIYLYPEENKNISVKLGNYENLICSYPKYTESGWNVFAKTNGDLIDINSQRNLYSLYYESLAITEFKIEKEGFVVKGEDSAKFLEEKLEELGLTEREANEFIIYWLPKLENNKYNYIRFANLEEINDNMPLEITPNPDTTIRVLMIFKGLNEKIEVIEQKLEKTERNGFVAVEWGGLEIK